jgi:hypothetical protein
MFTVASDGPMFHAAFTNRSISKLRGCSVV